MITSVMLDGELAHDALNEYITGSVLTDCGYNPSMRMVTAQEILNFLVTKNMAPDPVTGIANTTHIIRRVFRDGITINCNKMICSEKIPHETEQEALDVIDYLEQSRTVPRGFLTIYKCECGFFHLAKAS